MENRRKKEYDVQVIRKGIFVMIRDHELKPEEPLEEAIRSVENETEPPKPGNKRGKKTKFLLFLLFMLIVGAVVLYTAVHEFGNKPPEKLGFAFGPYNYMMIGLGFGCMILTLVFEALKYLLMMKTLGVKISLRAAFETSALGRYYDNITPSGIGGQPFQIYNMHKHGYSGGVSAAMPLTAFLTMQLGFVFLAVLVFIFRGEVVSLLGIRITAYCGAVMYSLLPLLIILFTISERSATKILRGCLRLGHKVHLVKNPEKRMESLVETLKEYRSSVILLSRRKGVLPLLFALSFFYQVSVASIPYFVLRAYNGSSGYFDILAMTMFIYCTITFIPTPGNSGAAEGSFYLIFSQLDPTGLFWSMLIWRVICYYSYIVIGFLIYGVNGVRARIRRKKGEVPDGEQT